MLRVNHYLLSRVTLCLTLAVLLLFVSVAQAATRTVSNRNDSGFGSLRDALAAAQPGDRIEFSVTGTITLFSSELVVNKNVTIMGPGAANLTIARSTMNGVPQFRIFKVSNGTATGPTVAISGLTISNGNIDREFGGGLYNENGTVTVQNCAFRNNSAAFTGGVANFALGGGSASMALINCTFTGSRTSYGYGAVINRGHALSNASMTLTHCTLTDNSGGFDNNAMVDENGRAGSANASLRNCTISGNSGSGVTSQAIAGATVSLSLTNCTITGNTDTVAGGVQASGQTTILNTIIAGNSADIGPDVRASNGVTSLGHNLIGKTDGSSGWVASDKTGTAANPLNPQLGPLQNNGGQTQTHALSAGSPALDAGNDAVTGAPHNLITDQRGPGFPRKSGGRVDIGAFEVVQKVQSSPFTVNWLGDDGEGACTDVHCTLREAFWAANASPVADTINFAPGLTGTITLTQGELRTTTGPRTTINGPGARVLAIKPNGSGRLFIILFDSALTISGLTIRDGVVTSGVGEDVFGGAIYNDGELQLSGCTLSGNRVQGANGTSGRNGSVAVGGAIFNRNSLELNACTFSGNSATGGNGSTGRDGGDGLGGAIYNGGALSLSHCTFAGNTGTGGKGGDGNLNGTIGGDGGEGSGAIYCGDFVNITGSTLTGNTGTGGAGGKFGGTRGKGSGGLTTDPNSIFIAWVSSTIVAGNVGSNGGADVDGTFISQGYNLIGKREGSTAFTEIGDQSGTNAAPLDAKLGPLQNNGGPTDTMALLAGSPAIDKGRNTTADDTDQRGQARPYDDPAIANASAGDGSDIGAYERFIPSLSISNPRAFNEGSASIPGSTTFAIRLAAASAQTVTVQYNTVNGAVNPALAGSDYVAKSGTLTFSPGQVLKTVVVNFIGDSVAELNETFFMDLKTPVNATIAANRGKAFIGNDDGPGISIDNATSVTEGNSGTRAQNFVVKLSAASTNTVTVDWATGNGPTTGGAGPADFTVATGTLSFAPGETSKTITIQVKGDTTVEPNEKYFVNLSRPTFAIIADSQGSGFILNDDTAGGIIANDEPSR